MPREWLPEDAARCALQAGVGALGDHHWKVIASMREEAARLGRLPSMRRIQKLTGFGAAELHELFPGNTESLIARLAGFGPPISGSSAAGRSEHEEEAR